jgi:branched-chain amino acid aminotransferase
MTRVVLETCKRNNLRDAYIRLVITRGKGDLGLDPRKCPRASVFCIAAAIELYPAVLYEKGLDLVTVGTRRNAPDALDPRIKSLNYLNNILAKMEATRAGAPEGLFLNKEGYVAEATGDNIFIVKNGNLYTPPPHVGLLEGITRNTVMELAARAGIPVAERVFTRYEVYAADECFLTGTAAEVIPVVRVDGRLVGSGQPGPISRDLIVMFRELTKSDGPQIFSGVKRGEKTIA